LFRSIVFKACMLASMFGHSLFSSPLTYTRRRSVYQADHMQIQCRQYREKMRMVKEQHENEIAGMRQEFTTLTEQVCVFV